MSTDTHEAALIPATAALSHPGLIRIISEIDDNGPLHRHLLSRTLTGLSPWQRRQASAVGRALGLLKASSDDGIPSLDLTPAGEALADVYDTAARWARTHHHPSDVSDFVTRVQATLALLGSVQPRPGHAPELDYESLDEPKTALTSWIRDHGATLATQLTGASRDEMELAA
ncbi:MULTISPECIES: hypothetical protein [unclassified Streptomyces]|uniref:hypothetical protein n=1 Tax=unclassified Streptomyces TaxID=2593676 RepID=UPI000DC79DE9|nr:MULTISPECIES: hypothetical protein [unclassified Streptomyces]AWZ08351.1 hypothetical protein DRB89_31435 [Streptomyces sp. ICC4]AWZ16135.1 hypothetical protein DRB96_32210 [Streptomyces sp. ICC1]